MKDIIITTTETIPGREISEVLGLVTGSTIQTRHLGSHILAALQMLIGGEIKGYVQAVRTAREEATARMIASAEEVDADAIVGMRYSTSQIMNGGAEILAYGTAVKFR